MVWPAPQDYAEAIQTPLLSFSDPELQQGTVHLNALGLPRCLSGAFATVFRMDCPDRKVAVRCFLSNIEDQEERYAQISRFVLSDDLPYTVGFEYVRKGIQVRGEWYPILKMEWVDGDTLGTYLSSVKDPALFGIFAGYFKQMTLELKRAGIAHGDFQHDNILIADTELRLVDYDGMFVPSLSGRRASELGHRNYQHPARDRHFFSDSLDNFSAWVIYASLRCLSFDPSLWNHLNAGNDCLLFRHADLRSPSQSWAFKVLDQHADQRIRRYSGVIQTLLEMPIQDIPSLEVPLSDFKHRTNSNPQDVAPSMTETPSANEDAPAESDEVPEEAVEESESTTLIILNPDVRYPQLSNVTLPPRREITKVSVALAVQPQLLPHETVHFVSSPHSRAYPLIAPLCIAFSGVVWLAFSNVFIGILGLLLSLIYLRYLVETGSLHRTVYLVTTKRIIVAEISASKSTVYSVPLSDVHGIEVISQNRLSVNAINPFRLPDGFEHHQLIVHLQPNEQNNFAVAAIPKGQKFIRSSP